MIKIFDTTLRDGEQSPGCSMTIDEKVKMAKQLEILGVDIIEAGFGISSQGDFKSIQEISKVVSRPVITSLGRASEKDIDVAYESLKYAKKKRIHTFVATSPVHMKYKLEKTEDEVYDMAVKAVAYAKSKGVEVQFSPEDATRTDLKFLCRVIEGVIKAGADVINVPDTTGYALPKEYHDMFKYIFDHVEGADSVEFAVHCHNDLGVAVANSLAGIEAGALQVECTVNGIGERAGNAAMEEIVMALDTRYDYYGKEIGINKKEIVNTSKMLQEITIPVQAHKAIVGQNAFAHEAGIHQHGLLSNRATYEIMKPEDVGWDLEMISLGKHSGKHAIKDRLKDLGYSITDEQMEEVFVEFKNQADTKKKIEDEDLIAIYQGVVK